MRFIEIPAARRRAVQRRLLAWYRQHQRALPWRRTRNPYHILVSEIMLQQTQVSRVVPKYREWLKRYPSVEALARATTRDVREAWYPLGYNVRPMRLREIARTALRRHGGRIPDSRDELLALKGIGPYTAGAVLSFAFKQDAAILDTNVRRVLRRLFLGEDLRAGGLGPHAAGRSTPSPGRGRPPDRVLWEISRVLVPRGRAYDFNQALMDLGAAVCTARRPRCPACPLAPLCRSAQT